jgi:hypothetical protein
VEDDLFVNRVFETVDDDQSGEIEWPEFVAAMSALEKGQPALKGRFFFQIYDHDSVRVCVLVCIWVFSYASIIYPCTRHDVCVSPRSLSSIQQDDFISKQDLSLMFSSSSMLKDDATTREVVETFVNKIFKLFGKEEEGKISLPDVLQYMENDPKQQDVWSLFGRSMLK